MARPLKRGLEYFPLDVALDKKFELIEAEFGLNGFGVVVKLLQEIYGQQGYYVEWTNEVALLFSRKVGLGANAVSEIVTASTKRGIFNQSLFDKYQILTSKGIQERYFEAISRRKNIEVEKQYLLVNVASYQVNVINNPVNVNINSENDNDNPQSKVKKSKVKKSKETIVSPILQTPSWKGFVAMRTQIKSPLTERAITMAISELEKLAPNDIDLQQKILDQSTYKCWKGLFELKDYGGKEAPAHGDNTTALPGAITL